ncbi:glycosyltransferase [Azospirillum sp. TSO22-1]|uniref:O-linked N-acetylglucosamine transferase, SPINDLY family protein n=1 Tax=Azospirillum sp. TSO22-1 TaxID=716789 RepID=UPI000D64FBB7|nr:glycosyltransferase [Azospirillum sp. TSO22-1]
MPADDTPAGSPSAVGAVTTLPEAYALAARQLEAGDLALAAHVVGCILAVRPEMPEALHLDGLIRLRSGRPAEAVERFAAALAGRRSPVILSSLGSALQLCGRLDEAVAVQAEAVALEPAAPTWRRNLAVLLQAAGRDGEAEAALRAAAGLGDAEALYMLGRRRFEHADAEGAARAFAAACAVRPDHAEAMTGLGLCRAGAERRGEALALHARALALDPGRLEDAVHGLDVARTGMRFDAIEPWRGRLADTLPRAFGRAHWHLLSSVLYRDLYRPLPEALRTRTEAALTERLQALAAAAPVPRPAPAADGRLRVGYLSGLLANHPVGQVTLSQFAAHDRARIETHGFLRKPASPDDPYAARHRAGFERVHELAGLPPEAAAQRIREADIDVLVYLDGHMDKDGLAIMAHRPAPVRVFWLGHAGGIGTACADYLLADRHVVPPGAERAYAERLVRLPECYHCADRHPIAERPRRADHGLPEDGVVFCAFNNTEKIDEPAFRAWMDILRQVPGSVLWLSGSPRGQVAATLQDFAASLGVAPERIVFAGRVPDKRDHLARYQLADLFLDTWTMNASSTALDALWAGVPIMVRAGDCFSNRISTSMLHAVGLGALVCPDARAYAALAVALALNPAVLAEWRARLWMNRETTPLFDAGRFARKLEAAFTRMHALSAAGLPPQAFDL